MSTPNPDERRPFADPADGIGYPLDPPISSHDAESAALAPTGPDASGTASTPATFGTPEAAPGSHVHVPEPLPRAGLSRAKIMAITPILATVAFFICGNVFGGWAWAWIFFLAVPLAGILTKDD